MLKGIFSSKKGENPTAATAPTTSTLLPQQRQEDQGTLGTRSEQTTRSSIPSASPSSGFASSAASSKALQAPSTSISTSSSRFDKLFSGNRTRPRTRREGVAPEGVEDNASITRRPAQQDSLIEQLAARPPTLPPFLSHGELARLIDASTAASSLNPYGEASSPERISHPYSSPDGFNSLPAWSRSVSGGEIQGSSAKYRGNRSRSSTNLGLGVVGLAELEPWITGSLPPPPRSPSSSWSKKRKAGSSTEQVKEKLAERSASAPPASQGSAPGSGPSPSPIRDSASFTTSSSPSPQPLPASAFVALGQPYSTSTSRTSILAGQSFLAPPQNVVVPFQSESPTLIGSSPRRGSFPGRASAPRSSNIRREHRRTDSAPPTTPSILASSIPAPVDHVLSFATEQPQHSSQRVSRKKRDSQLSTFSSATEDSKTTTAQPTLPTRRERTLSRISSIFKAKDTPANSPSSPFKRRSGGTIDGQQASGAPSFTALAPSTSSSAVEGGQGGTEQQPVKGGGGGSKLWKRGGVSPFRRPSLSRRRKSSQKEDISEDYVEINAADLDAFELQNAQPPSQKPSKGSSSRGRRQAESAVTGSERSRIGSATSSNTIATSGSSSLLPRPSKSSKAPVTNAAASSAGKMAHSTETDGQPPRSVSFSSGKMSAEEKEVQRAVNSAMFAQGPRPRRTSAAPALSSSSPAGSGFQAGSQQGTIGRSAGSQILQEERIPNLPAYDIAAVLEDTGISKTSQSSLRKRAQSEASKQARQQFPSSDGSEGPVMDSPAKTTRFASLRRFMRSGSRTKSNPTHPSEVKQSMKISEFGVLPDPAKAADYASDSSQQRLRTKSESKPAVTSTLLSPLKAREPPVPRKGRPSRDGGNLQEVQESAAETDGGDETPTPSRPTEAAMERVRQGTSRVEGLPASSLEILRTQTPTKPQSPSTSVHGLPQDRNLTLQALQASPQGTKRSKATGLRPSSATTTDEDSMSGSQGMYRRPSGSSASSSLGMGLALGGGANGSTEILSSIGPGRQPSRLPGFVSAPSNLSERAPMATIPKMWTADAVEPRVSREGREPEEEGRPSLLASSSHRTGLYQSSSIANTEATTGSWRTAAESINDSPDRQSRASAQLLSTFESRGSRSLDLQPTNQNSSPLFDLISHLDRRANHSHSEEYGSSAEIRNEIERLDQSPAIAAGPSPEPIAFPSYTSASSSHDTGAASYGSPSVGSTPRTRKRNTFGGTESLSRGFYDSPSSTAGHQSTPASRPTRPGELSLSEIESNLAIVEAALNDHSVEGSFDPTVLRRRLGSPEQTFASSAVTRNASSVRPSESSPERITLRPQSHEAIVHAVREVRRALSNSQLSRRLEDHPEEEQEELQDVDTGSLDPRASQQDNTPARNARNRKISIRDVEETYGRMVHLVTASAGIAPPPMPQSDEGISWPRTRDAETPSRPGRASGEQKDLPLDYNTARHSGDSYHSSAGTRRRRDTINAASADESAIDPSILGRGTEFDPDEMAGMPTQDPASAGGAKRSSGGSNSNRGTSNTSPSIAVKTQGTPHSSLGNMSRGGDAGRRSLDQKSAPSQARSSLEARRTSFDRLQAAIDETRIPEEIPASVRDNVSVGHESRYRSSSRASLMRNSPGPATLVGVLRQSLDGATTRQRHSSEAPRPLSRYNNFDMSSHRGLHPVLDDLADSQTVGTSIFGSPSTSNSLAHLQRRHNLEKNSLLDALERAKSEADQYRQQNEQLRSDLHQEVARLLELERAFEQSAVRETELQSKVEKLEDQLRAEHEARIDLLEKLERISALWPANGESANEDDVPETEQAGSSIGSHSSRRRQTTNSVTPSLSSAPSGANNASIRHLQPVAAQSTKVHTVRQLSNSPIMTTRIFDDDLAISSDSDENNEDSRRAATAAGARRSAEQRGLRTYPSELGLHINSQEMSWGNLVDETAPMETSRASSPEDVSGSATQHRSTRSVDSSSSKNAEITSPSRKSIEGSSTDSPISSGLTKLTPISTEESPLRDTTKQPSASSPSPAPASSIATKRRSGLPLPSAPVATSSVARTVSSGSIAGEGRRVPGSLPSSSTSSIRSAAQSQLLQKTGSATAAPQSPTRAAGPGAGTGIPMMKASGSISGHSRIPSIGGGGGLRKVSAVSAATSGADSSFTARSNSPIGAFVTERGGKGGHYDPRRPEGYDPVEVPEGLKAIADDSIDSVEEINAAGRSF